MQRPEPEAQAAQHRQRRKVLLLQRAVLAVLAAQAAQVEPAALVVQHWSTE